MKRSSAHFGEIWLTIYADMITNLLLLFLALYGLTVLGQDALTQAVLSMKFSDLERLEFLVTKDDFQNIPIQLKTDLKGENISIVENADAIRIEFGEGILFPSGRSHTKLSAEPVLMKVAQVLKSVPYSIIIEGHTDAVPLSNKSQFKNNRELSLARAMTVVRWMMDKGGISAAQLAAASYGEFKPRSSNQTSAGRAMNRRVEIVLLKAFPYEKNK